MFVSAWLLALAAAPAGAGQVAPMTLSDMSDLAGQAIVGEVESVRSYWAENPRRIESEVLFKNVEYLKGRLPESGASFRLLIPSGQVGPWGMRISCAPTMAAGDRWVLFLLPSYKTFPVVGLHQGAFRLEADADGVLRVFDAARRPVTGVSADGIIQAAGGSIEHAVHQHEAEEAGAAQDPEAELSVGTVGSAAPAGGLVSVNGVRVQFVGPTAPKEAAMSYDDFVTLIRPVLEQSSAHRLSGPAGRPELVPYRAVPFRKSLTPAGGSPPGAAPAGAHQPACRQARPVRRFDLPPRKPSDQVPDAATQAREVRP